MGEIMTESVSEAPSMESQDQVSEELPQEEVVNESPSRRKFKV